MSNPPTPKPGPDAWLFATKHARIIAHLSRRFGGSRALNREDFQQELLLYVVERYHSYNPEKSGPYTWIQYQARAVAKRRALADRRLARARAAAETAAQISPTAHERMERQTRRHEVTRILSDATPQQAEACQAMVAGLSKIEVREALGIGYQGMHNRISRMSRAYADYPTN